MRLDQIPALFQKYRTQLLTLLAGFIAAVSIAVVIDPDGPNGPVKPITITVSDTEGQTKTLTVPQAAVTQATGVKDHALARSEAPDGVRSRDLNAAREQQEQLAATDQLPIVTPDAAPEQDGCLTRLVGNYSSRRGVRPRLFVLHYTVSPNRPGWSDVLAIVSLFDRPAFAASSHYVIDSEGHCAYIVRESDKAWTQAAFNPVSISVEQINSGHEPTYAGTAGLAKLARVIDDATRRWEIPLRLGAVSGCTVTRSGIVTHEMLGGCGGGHVDISPYRAAPVIAAARALRAAAAQRTRVTHVDRVTCRKLLAYRRAGRPRGGLWEKRSVRRRRALAQRDVTCYRRGPVRRP